MMKMLKKINETDYQGEHLIFAETIDDSVTIENGDYESLGILIKQKVGRWSSWVLFLSEDCWLSAECLDEVREMMKILNAKIRKRNES